MSETPDPSAHEKETAMYDMYPEWGPAKNRADDAGPPAAVQTALDLRDNGAQRPDDN